MSQYPIILIPEAITQALSARPFEWKFSEPKPLEPGQKPRPINLQFILSKAIPHLIVTSIISAATAKIPAVAWSAFLSGLSTLGLRIWRQQQLYLKRLHKYEYELQQYKRQLIAYQERENQHKRKVAESQKPENINKYRYKLIREIMSKAVPHNGTNIAEKQEIFNGELGKYLKQLFPKKIYNAITMDNPTSYIPYQINIAFIDQSLHLYIDIEIDEPYNDEKTGEPVYEDVLNHENKRHQLFLDKGWLVIRFAEEQVIRQPESCCKVIANVINKLSGIPVPKQLNQVESLQKYPSPINH
ncbi:hypothetical protein ACE1CI_09575 [Aerosakkonemataceae cyanobacterium BLCC-F50]|uniref:DUF559 domain-containing protein n=1 Tax=Floridaenema flaviceps BLCC-F50 TaxID=3153642 RepID=A0ABV4XPG9_9CYAN